MYPDKLVCALFSVLCALSVLWVIWTYRIISRAELGAQATHLTDKLDATLHIDPPPTPATFALRQDDRATGRQRPPACPAGAGLEPRNGRAAIEVVTVLYEHLFYD